MNWGFEKQLNELANSMKEVEGVTYIGLYGSYARGDFDTGSDVDILVLFQDKESMKMNSGDVLRRAGRSEMFLQITMFTLDEFFKECNPVFVRSVIRDGKILFQREPEKIENYLRRFMQRYPELVLKES